MLHCTSQVRLVCDKHSSLLFPSVSYQEKKILWLWPAVSFLSFFLFYLPVWAVSFLSFLSFFYFIFKFEHTQTQSGTRRGTLERRTKVKCWWQANTDSHSATPTRHPPTPLPLDPFCALLSIRRRRKKKNWKVISQNEKDYNSPNTRRKQRRDILHDGIQNSDTQHIWLSA